MRLSDMQNLGPASERMLSIAGVSTPEQLGDLGAAAAYRRVVDTGLTPSLNLLWALEGALVDLDWRDIPDQRKQELLEESERAAP